MDKIYHKTTWQNSPSTNTPINETNLNNIENGVDAIDNRVVDLGNTKSSVDWVQLQQGGDKIAEITIDGVKKAVYSKQASGSVLDNALKSEGFAVGTQDGQPVSSGSPYFENNAKYYAEDSARSSAESKYWSEKSGSSRLVSMDDVDINSPQDKQALVYDATTQKWINGQGSGGGGTSDYNDLTNRPQINGTELVGNKSADDLGLALKQDLNNKTMSGTKAEFDAIKDSLPDGSSFDILDDYDSSQVIVQFGSFQVDSASTSATQVQLPIEMNDTNYAINLIASGGNTNYFLVFSISAKTTSSFSFIHKNVGAGGSSQRSIYWNVIGKRKESSL